MKVELIATATFGLEALVAKEVRELGYEDVQVEDGKVTFKGDLNAICRANLWLRTADRVKLKIGQFKATSFEELFQKVKALPWSEWLPKNANFPVDGKSVRSKLFSISDCQAITKKAIVEHMKEKYKLQWFDEDGPVYKIEVALLKDIATLTIDTTGAGLHKRGYRDLSAPAPLKETLAAGLIMLTNWNWERPLIDPFCGSGTIPIEAAMIGKNIAPGMNREFISENWFNLDKKLWMDARKETHDLAEYDRKLNIAGYDIDGKVVRLARHHAQEAMVEEDIHFQERTVLEISSPKSYGYIVTNPPYGERLGERDEVQKLYKEMGKVFQSSMDTWSYYIITSHKGFEKLFGKEATKRRKLYNGNIETQYYQYYGPRPPRRTRVDGEGEE